MSDGPDRVGPAAADGPVTDLDRQIARNTVFLFAGRLASILGWTVLAPYMLARLGADRFGLWSLVTVLSGLSLTLDFGLASAVTRFVAEFRAASDHARLRGVVTLSALLYTGLGALVVLGVALARAPIVSFLRIPAPLAAEASTALLVAAVAYALLNGYMLASSVLGGLQRLDLWNRVSIVVTLLQLAGTVVILQSGGGIPALLVNSAAGLVVGTIWCTAIVRRLAPEIAFDLRSVDRAIAQRLTRYSVALQLINLGGLLQFQLAKVFYGRFVSLAAVGSYELGWRVTSAAWAAPALMLPALVPAVAHLEARGERERVVRLHRRATRYVLAVAWPLAALLVALAPALYAAWLGPGHRDAALACATLATFLAVNVLTGVGSAVVRGIGRPGIEVEYHAIAMALHVALGLALVPRLGFPGGLMALAISGAVGSLWFVVRFQRLIGDPLAGFVAGQLVRPLAVAIAAGLVAALVSRGWSAAGEWTRGDALAPLLAGGIAGALVAISGVLALRVVTAAELRGLAALALGRARPAVGTPR